MPNTLQFWFELASTYSYPAAERVRTLVRCGDVKVDYRPFLLGPIFAAQGWKDSPFNIYPSKGRYMWQDLETRCEELKIPFRHPASFPQNSLKAARLCCALTENLRLPDIVCNLYRAHLAEKRDIALESTLKNILDGQELDPVQWLARANQPNAKATLRANTEQAIQLGIFGAPSFIVNGRLYWGEDRLDRALASLGGRK